MAVLSNISVGDITFYVVDSVPTHTASKGSISMLGGTPSYDNSFLWINNNGGTVWLKMMRPTYGELLLTNGTTTIDPDGTQTLGSWYAFNSTDTWTQGDVTTDISQFASDRLRYSGTTAMRAYVRQESTLVGGSARWVQWQVGVSKNFTVPTRLSGCFAFDTGSGTVHAGTSRLVNFLPGDYVLGAVSPVSRENGGSSFQRAYIPKYCQLNIIKLDESLSTTIFTENWESQSFSTNSWTVANDTTNVWVIGSAQNNTSGGTYGVYISNNGGTTATYTNTTANVSHFYRDFTFSSGVNITLTFDWKCQGENSTTPPVDNIQFDYGTVVITTTGTTPTAGTEVITTQTPGDPTTRIGATSNVGKFNIAYGSNPGTIWNTESIDLTAYAGQTKRIVFTWRNDTVNGTNPAFIVDNIRIVEYMW